MCCRLVSKIDTIQKAVTLENPLGRALKVVRTLATRHLLFRIAFFLIVFPTIEELRDRAMQLTLRLTTEVMASCHILARKHKNQTGSVKLGSHIGRQARLTVASNDPEADGAAAAKAFRQFSNSGIHISGALPTPLALIRTK